jgi:antitoxin (DNA-binding transcriptional repressor) of toxin-antitoxin stability system
LNRIRYQGETFEVARNGEVIAELVPAGRKRFTVGEFLDMWRRRPRLDRDEAAAFEGDLADIRASAKAPPSPWE